MMNIVDWFDPDNIEHLKAYRHLQNFGLWPGGFLPDDIEIPSLWSTLIKNKIVEFFIDEMLGEELWQEQISKFRTGE